MTDCPWPFLPYLINVRRIVGLSSGGAIDRATTPSKFDLTCASNIGKESLRHTSAQRLSTTTNRADIQLPKLILSTKDLSRYGAFVSSPSLELGLQTDQVQGARDGAGLARCEDTSASSSRMGHPGSLPSLLPSEYLFLMTSSNFLRFGTKPRVRSAMQCSGAMRSVMLSFMKVGQLTVQGGIPGSHIHARGA